MSIHEKAIGIDLGTTYSCVSIWRNNKPEIIPNDLGERTTPSVVSFSEKERFIGESAKNQIVRNYMNTVYDAKRLIGRRFNDEIVQKDMKLWPFKVEKAADGERPKIVVQYKKEKRTFFPEEISAMILGNLKKNVEDYIGEKIKNAGKTSHYAYRR